MKKLTVFLLFVFFTVTLSAQDFGFGFDDEETSSKSGSSGAGGGLSATVGGEVAASMVGYLKDFSEGAEHTRLGNIFSGKLNFTAKAGVAEGYINLKIKPEDSPVKIDEAYLRAFFGKFDIEAGLRKLTWGKADSMGPLDVVNPLDTSQIYTEMADNTSLMGVKIARPMLHASLRFGQFSKIEGIFIPNFEPHYIDADGRWAPAQMEEMKNPSIPIPVPIPVKINTYEKKPDTTTFNYAQGGVRFTTTIRSADIGAQYYYGRLFQPAAKITLTEIIQTAQPIMANIDIMYLYNPYHQIGFDYAQVLAGFNVRAEVAANITEDLKGDDGSVYNPSIAWSLGFDRNLFLGINLNLQVNENIRLMQGKLGKSFDKLNNDDIDLPGLMSGNYSFDMIDIEGGKPLTATRFTAALSKKFLRDEFELRTAVVWGIEDYDCLIMPALIWTKDSIRAALSGGFFAGNSDGQLGQYKDNNFLKVSLAFKF